MILENTPNNVSDSTKSHHNKVGFIDYRQEKKLLYDVNDIWRNVQVKKNTCDVDGNKLS